MTKFRPSDMKITSGPLMLFLITGLGHGGAETQLLRLVTHLKARNWSIRVVSMLPPKAFINELDQASIPVASLGMHRGVPDIKAFFRLVYLLRRDRPLILTSFMYHANLLGRIAGGLAGVPVRVSSIRNENFGGLVRERMMRLTDWLSDVTVMNSTLAGETVLGRRVVPTGKLQIIPNGIDTTRFVWTPEMRMQVFEEFGLDEEAFIWLGVGRLEEQKDYPNLLIAFAQVVYKRPEAMLLVAGRGVLRKTLEKMVNVLGLERHVCFLGVRTDIPNLLAAADAFVLSSAWEGLPNVVMEALAARKPVVATQVGGVPELVEDGKSGFLVPPKNPKALARAMLRLMDLPPEYRQSMGERGFEHIEENFSLERVVDQWEALFMESLEAKGYKIA